MSAAAAARLIAPVGPTPVEYVRALPPEDQEDILIDLIRAMIAYNGGKGLIPIETPEGESLGYYVPPAAADARAELYLPKLSPERMAELVRRIENPGDAISAEQFIAELRAAADRLQTQSP